MKRARKTFDDSLPNKVREALSNPHAVCRALGVAKGAQRQSRGLTIVCPWHDEKTGSCSVTTGRDGTIRVHCHGCGESGDVLHLVAKVNGLDIKKEFRRVLKVAAELSGRLDLVPDDAIDVDRRPTIADGTFDAIARALFELCPMNDGGDAAAYLRKRGLFEQAKADGWGELPTWARQRALVAELLTRFDEAELDGAGLLYRYDGQPWQFARAAHRLLIPWRDGERKIHALQRRLLRDPRDKKEPKYIFTPGRPARLPYGIDTLDGHAELLIVEGAADVLAARALNRDEPLDVIGIPGTQTWVPSWAGYGVGAVVGLGFDADKAGDRIVQAIAADVRAAGGRPVRVRPEGAKDWAELTERRAA